MKNRNNLKILAAGLAALVLLTGAAAGHLTQLVQLQLQGVAGPGSIGKGLIDAGSSGVKGLFKVFGLQRPLSEVLPT